MIKNYIKIAWRNLLKSKTFSFINIFGLALGLATCLLLSLYISDELRYDSHHKDVDQIYRIAMESLDMQIATSSAPLASTMKAEFPEIEETTRVLKFPNVDKLLLQNKEKPEVRFYETKGYFADSTFFDLFSYSFSYGETSTALNSPNSVVISQSISDKLFGQESPINKLITIEIPYAVGDYTVTGVFNDQKTKSHISANLFLSMKNDGLGEWVDQQDQLLPNNLFHSYIKLKKGTSSAELETKFSAFTERHIGDELAQLKMERSYFLQPLKDIYLKSQIRWEISKNGNIKYIYIFSAIAAFLLIIACINFMNLSTAKSEKRGKEVGMRKVLGAKRSALIFQFLTEALILCIISLALALIFVFISLDAFNSIVGKQLSLSQSPNILFWISGMALFTGLLSGIYPAFYLSSFKPISVLRGRLVNTFSAKAIRKGLVVFQFTISACLILVGSMIWQQLDFIKNQDLGFNKDQQLIITFRNQEVSNSYEALKSELLKNPNVVSATAGDIIPGLAIVNDNTFYAEGKSEDFNAYTRFGHVQDDYIQTLGYELLYGRPFSKNIVNDSASIILNEVALEQLGYEPKEAIGKSVYSEWQGERTSYEIIGVMKNFNFESLHEPISPYGLKAINDNQNNYFIASLSEGNLEQTIADVEKVWSTINPNTPIEYTFLDQNFNNNYKSEQQASQVILSFMLIAIFIACIGLFGLASFTTEQRRKEVGIRRVLGASIAGITMMHLNDFLKLVLIAVIIASPIAYYFGDLWLQSFAYKIKITPLLFIQTGLITAVIALITIGGRTIKSACANPSENLRSE